MFLLFLMFRLFRVLGLDSGFSWNYFGPETQRSIAGVRLCSETRGSKSVKSDEARSTCRGGNQPGGCFSYTSWQEWQAHRLRPGSRSQPRKPSSPAWRRLGLRTASAFVLISSRGTTSCLATMSARPSRR